MQSLRLHWGLSLPYSAFRTAIFAVGTLLDAYDLCSLDT